MGARVRILRTANQISAHLTLQERTRVAESVRKSPWAHESHQKRARNAESARESQTKREPELERLSSFGLVWPGLKGRKEKKRNNNKII